MSRRDRNPPDVQRYDLAPLPMYARALAVLLVQHADIRGELHTDGSGVESIARVLGCTPGDRRLLRKHLPLLERVGFLVPCAGGYRIRGYHQTRETLSGATCNRFVYFALRESDGCVKIGVSNDERSRLSDLRAEHGSDVRLLFALRVRDAEFEWHRVFAKQRISGEWFRPDASMQQIIDIIERDHSEVYGASGS